MAVYRHFADLDGLLAAVAARGFEMLTEYLNAAQNQAKTRLEQLGVAYVDFAHANPSIYRLIFQGNHFGTPEDPSCAARL